MLFSNKDLKKLIGPLIIEQILALTIGLFDTMMVSQCGEAAVSGVSLVDGLNILALNIFAALATGGAVVCSQYIGSKNKEKSSDSAKQLLYTIFFLAIMISIVCIIFNTKLITLAFGKVEADVLEACRIYFFYSALSYPFIGLFNGGAALFRSMGNSKVAMINSFFMNICNVGLNYIMIFPLNMGVRGAAIATLISRIVCSLITLHMLKNPNNIVHIDSYTNYKVDFETIKKILKIGVPNGLENGMFQMGKILVQRLVTSFGTAAIAAHAVAFTLSGIVIVPGAALGLAMLTVVGQCCGADDYDQATFYIKKLMMYSIVLTATTAILMYVFANGVLGFYALEKETAALACKMVRLHCTFDIIIWPIAFTLPNALRAANDASYTMVVSSVSMWLCRFALSYVFALYFNMGVIGVWWAMIVDWFFRSAFFIYRYQSKKWMNRKLI